MATFKIKDKETGEILTVREKDSTKSTSPLVTGKAKAGQLIGSLGGYALGAELGHPNLGGAIGGAALGTKEYLSGMKQQKLMSKDTPIMQKALMMSPAPIAGMPQIDNPISLAATYQAMTPSEKKNLEEYAKKTMGEQALAGATSYAIGKVARGVQGVWNVAKGSSFLTKVRGQFNGAMKQAGQAFGKTIENLSDKYPTVKSDLTNVLVQIEDSWKNMSQEARNVFKKTPIIRDMVDKFGKIKTDVDPNVALKDAQKVLNYLNTKVPKNIKSTNIDILDATSEIRGSMLDAFPDELLAGKNELLSAKKQYGVIRNAYKLLKNKLKEGSTQKTILGDAFKDPDIMKAMQTVLPRETIEQIKNYAGVTKVKQFIPKMLAYSALGWGGLNAIKRRVSGGGYGDQ